MSNQTADVVGAEQPPAGTQVNGGVDRWAAAIWFLGCLGILCAAVLLRPGQNGQVLLPWVDVALPETCTMRGRFGIDCPGCGLTRSFIHTANGDWGAAWRMHSLGLVLFGYVLLQLPLSLALWMRIEVGSLSFWTRLNVHLFLGLSGLLLIVWLLRLTFGVST